MHLFISAIVACAWKSRRWSWIGPTSLLSGAGAIKIEELWLYPIKGCKGFRVSSAKMTTRGLQHDRVFVVVKESNGVFVSQRGLPKMALLRTSLNEKTNCLEVTATHKPEVGTLSVSLDETTFSANGVRKVTVWGQECNAMDCGKEAGKWFSEALQSEEGLQLVYMADTDEFNRPAGKRREEDGVVSFADQYPILLASVESLVGLNARLEKEVEMERFRPNVVVTGVAEPFTEDSWDSVYFLDSTTASNKLFMNVPFPPCGRCKVPTNDIHTGELDPNNEPTKTMMGFRGGEHLGFEHRKFKKEVYFGIHLNAPSSQGKQELRVGDNVLVNSSSSLKDKEIKVMAST